MQKQKLFETFSCINHNNVSDDRFVYNLTQPEAPEAPKKAANEPRLESPEDKAANMVNAKLNDLTVFENAKEKNAKSMTYLGRRENNPAITGESLTNALISSGYLKTTSELSTDIDMMEAIKAMQRDLGFTGKDADGEIGKNTYGQMAKKRPDILLAIRGISPKEKPQTAEVKEKPELPAGKKAETEVQLSKVSDAIRLNYNTAADLHDKLFKTDGTLKQSPNTNDLTGYKAALDNISEQLKALGGIEGALKEYKIPDGLVPPKSALFATSEIDGRVFLHHYEYMQKNFEKRLAEFKRDYDRIVNDWAQRVAGKEGRTGNDVGLANLDKIFISEKERDLPVLVLLDKTETDFKGDVVHEAAIILAERNAKEDKEMADAKAKAEEGVRSAENKVGEASGTVSRINAEIIAANRANSAARTQVAGAREALESAQLEKSKNLDDIKFAAETAESTARETASTLEAAVAKLSPAQQELAQAEKSLGQRQQELAKLTTPNPAGGAAAATD